MRDAKSDGRYRIIPSRRNVLGDAHIDSPLMYLIGRSGRAGWGGGGGSTCTLSVQYYSASNGHAVIG